MRDALHKYEKRALSEAEARGVPIRFIAIDLSPVTDIDASAVHFLKARRLLECSGMYVLLCGQSLRHFAWLHLGRRCPGSSAAGAP